MKEGRRAFPETASGDHIILVYEDTARLFAFIVPFIKQGLADGERCVYVAAESRPEDIVAVLSAGGVRVNQAMKRGALILQTPREYFGLPRFDASRVTERLHEGQAEAISAGFAGLRVAAEMTWAGESGVPDEVLEEYEALLDNVRATRACIYREDRFDQAVLERLVRAHGKAVADDYVYLSLSALFRSLARMDLQGLTQSAHEQAARKGELYFRQGDRATDVYFLTAGVVKLVRTDREGRSVILRIVAPMEPFGDRVLALGGSVRLSSAEALEASRALVWDGPALVRVMLAHPAVSVSAIRLLEERVERERSRLLDFVSPDVRRRLARLLLRLGQYIGRKTRRGAVINVPLSRQDLAELAITSPYTVSRILAEWRRQDILDAQRTRIIIRDLERLAAIAG